MIKHILKADVEPNFAKITSIAIIKTPWLEKIARSKPNIKAIKKEY